MIPPSVNHTPVSAARAGIFTNLAGGLAVQAIGIVTGTLLARGLGPHDRGVIAAMVLWPTLVLSVGDFGIGSALAFFPARAQGAAKGYIRFAVRAAIIVSLILLPVGLLVTYVGLRAAGVQPIALGLALAAALIPSLLFSRYIAALAQGLFRFPIVYAIRISGVLPMAVIFAVEFVIGRMTVASVVAGYASGLVISVLVAFGAKRVLAGAEREGEAPPARALVSYGMRSVLGSLYPVEALWIDQMIVAISLGPRELGLYVVAAAFTTLPRVLADAIAISALPHIARADAPRRSVLGFLGVGVAVLVPCGVALSVAMPELLVFIFGQKFSASVVPAQLLVWGSVLFGLRRIAGDAMRGLGAPGRASAVEVGTWPIVLGVLPIASSRGLSAIAGALLGIQMLALAASLVVLGRALRRQVVQSSLLSVT